MKINQQVISILKNFNIPIQDGFCYLVSLFFGYKPSYIPEELKRKIHTTGIVDYNDGVIWKIPLFEGQEIAFAWVVEDYVSLFAEANPQKDRYHREAITRMKKFFSENPEIRKDDVIRATRLYLLNTDSKYIRYPHYFIKKGKGADASSDLLDWIDKLKLIDKNKGNETDNRKLM